MFLVTQLSGFGAGGDATIPYTESSSSTTGSAGNASFTVLDRSWAIDNGATVNSVGVYSTSAATITVKILNEDSTTQYDIVVSKSFSHGGSGWEDCTLDSPYTVPGTGTYRVGTYSTSNTNYYSADRSYKAGDASGNNQGFTADTSNTPSVRVTGTKPA